MSDLPPSDQDRAPPSSPWTRNAAATSAPPPAEAMKGNGFGDRARQLTEWFQAWNSCEQTIALYSLLSKVSAVQARFLSLVLEHSLKNGYDSKELTRLEKLANDASKSPSLYLVCCVCIWRACAPCVRTLGRSTMVFERAECPHVMYTSVRVHGVVCDGHA